MKKLNSAILMTTVLLGFSAATPLISTVSAQAATWHKGSPKIARGNWANWSKNGGPALGITKRTLIYTGHYPDLSRLSYQTVGTRRYKLRGYDAQAKKYRVFSTLHYLDKTHLQFTKAGHHYKFTKWTKPQM